MRCGGYPRRCISIPFWVGSKEAGQATCSFDWAVDDVFLPVSGEASRNRSNLRLALRSPQTCAFLNLSRRYRPDERAAQLLGRLQCEFDGDASPRPERQKMSPARNIAPSSTGSWNGCNKAIAAESSPIFNSHFRGIS